MTETVAVTLETEIRRPIGRVWNALTDSGTLSKWMMFKTNDFKPEVGHAFQFRDAPYFDGVIDCEVTEVDEPHRLAYSWTTQGVGGEPHATVVTWTLEEDDGTTRLHFQQSGFRPEGKQEIGGAKASWKMMLDELTGVVESA